MNDDPGRNGEEAENDSLDDLSRVGSLRESRWQQAMLGLIVVLCLLPGLLTALGLDFGSAGESLHWHALAGESPAAQSDALHHALTGSFTHTLLEWSAFCTALFTVILAFTRYTLHGDLVTPVLGMALFCAGCMDAFHTLAADRLIEATAENQNLIPFTWAICRLFNAVILLGGIGLAFLPFRRSTIGRLGFLAINSTLLLVLAYAVIHACATSASLPETLFPERMISRPWDVGPLVLFGFLGVFVLPVLHRRVGTGFSFALCLSAIPQVATQLHMALGSTVLFDNHFNIAHFLKILAYFVPFCGLVADHAITFWKVRRSGAAKVARLNRELREQVRRQGRELGEREKELTFLHGLNEHSINMGGDVESLCRAAVDQLPAAFQDRSATCARLTVSGRIYTSEGFAEFPDRLVSEYTEPLAAGGLSATLEVYANRTVMETAKVFLPEEQALLDSALQIIVNEHRVQRTISRYDLVAASHAVWDWDVPNHRVGYSARWKALRGYGPEELDDDETVWSDCIHPEDKARVMAAVQAHFEGESDVFEEEYRVRCKDGSWKWIADRGVALRDVDGKILRMVGSEVDISERKRMEFELRERTDHLERTNQELEKFAYVASHDLRSPLRAINNLATWIEEDAGDSLNETCQDHLKLMRQRVNRMDVLLDSILRYSRVGRREDSPRTLDLNELLADVVFLLDHPDTFTITVAPNLPTITAPRGALERVFVNLIDNAIKHHDRSDGRIEVSHREVGGFHEFAVRDDGPGISAEFHERIFGMFQVLQSRDTVEGSGIGLALVQKTIEFFGGSIAVESEPGHGTTFRFTWPCDSVVDEAP